jgi:hypothetical protein
LVSGGIAVLNHRLKAGIPSGCGNNRRNQRSRSIATVVLILQVKNLKVQMEELQWGFPIATPLSLNKPLAINGK